MAICSGCGGVLGVDCWNKRECVSITQDMAMQYGDNQYRIHELESEREQLINILMHAKHVLALPDNEGFKTMLGNAIANYEKGNTHDDK